jgi:hypothetical protein
MNLSELVQAYGSNNGSGDKSQEKSSKDTRPAKKSSSARAWKPKNNGQRVSAVNKHPQAMVYPPPVMIPQVPNSYPYDPNYIPHYPPTMFYGPPMMMMYPVPAPSTYSAPPMATTSNSAVQMTNETGEAAPNASSINSTEQASVVPVTLAPNFVPATFGPVYGYPYDLSYQYGYTPPHKRPKRGNSSQRKSGLAPSLRPPQSPGSDSAESSSSNASAPSASPIEKAAKPKKIHCEPCEKSFKTQQHYDAHLTTHAPCSYEGCTYSAVKGALRLHEMLHVNNMFAKLSSPEEIQRYREERKKRFPSMAKEQERLTAKEQEKASSSSSTDLSPQPSSSSSLQHNNTTQSPSQDAPTAISSKTDPISAIDEELEAQRANSRGKRKRPVCKYWKSGKCNKGEQCAFSHASDSNPSASSSSTSTTRSRRGTSITHPKAGPQTLLSQFLRSEQSKENKLILQCLRFIADNQFLRVDPPQ